MARHTLALETIRQTLKGIDTNVTQVANWFHNMAMPALSKPNAKPAEILSLETFMIKTRLKVNQETYDQILGRLARKGLILEADIGSETYLRCLQAAEGGGIPGPAYIEVRPSTPDPAVQVQTLTFELQRVKLQLNYYVSLLAQVCSVLGVPAKEPNFEELLAKLTALARQPK